jgi:hypothetical protein
MDMLIADGDLSVLSFVLSESFSLQVASAFSGVVCRLLLSGLTKLVPCLDANLCSFVRPPVPSGSHSLRTL